jgi:hypothetical protein
LQLLLTLAGFDAGEDGSPPVFWPQPFDIHLIFI